MCTSIGVGLVVFAAFALVLSVRSTAVRLPTWVGVLAGMLLCELVPGPVDRRLTEIRNGTIPSDGSGGETRTASGRRFSRCLVVALFALLGSVPVLGAIHALVPGGRPVVPLVFAGLGLACVVAAVLHAWRGGIDVKWDVTTLARGRTAVFHVATTPGSGVWTGSRALLRRVSLPQGPRGTPFTIWWREVVLPPETQPGPGEYVRIEFELPDDAAARAGERWEIVVHGRTLWGPVTEAFVVPVGCVPASPDEGWPAASRCPAPPTIAWLAAGIAVVAVAVICVFPGLGSITEGAEIHAAVLGAAAWGGVELTRFARNRLGHAGPAPASPSQVRAPWGCLATAHSRAAVRATVVFLVIGAACRAFPWGAAWPPAVCDALTVVALLVSVALGAVSLLRGGVRIRRGGSHLRARVAFDVEPLGRSTRWSAARFLLRCVETDPRWGLRVSRGAKPKIRWQQSVPDPSRGVRRAGETIRVVFDVPAGLPAPRPGVDWQLVVAARTPWGELSEAFPVSMDRALESSGTAV